MITRNDERIPNRNIVYLLGILPRSGTNYLSDLICLHPDCGRSERMPEDYLIANAHHLVNFVDAVYESWNMLPVHYDETTKVHLLRKIGAGLEEYLYSQSDDVSSKSEFANHDKISSYTKYSPKVLIARTPSVENIDLISRLTSSKTIIIVRDGRSVVDSGIRSFGWWFEDAVHRWARSADQILRTAPNEPKILWLRYEDLIADQAGQLRKLFTFLGLNPDVYEYNVELPVRGSSAFFDSAIGINWGETEKNVDFQPLQRWRNWDRARHERFNWIASKQLKAFSYEPILGGGFSWTVYNLILDSVWPFRQILRKAFRKILPKTLRDYILRTRGKRFRNLNTMKG